MSMLEECSSCPEPVEVEVDGEGHGGMDVVMESVMGVESGRRALSESFRSARSIDVCEEAVRIAV